MCGGYKTWQSGQPRCRPSTNMAVIALVLVLAAGALLWALSRGSRQHNRAPGPRAWPVLGNLHLLRGYSVPYIGLSHLQRVFGPVFTLQLGSVSCLAVHGLDNIKHILFSRAAQFDSRPGFDRYHRLFQGNKQNSLAFCDWSDLQRKRRDILKEHTFPKTFSNNFKRLGDIVTAEMDMLMNTLSDQSNNNTQSLHKLCEDKQPGLVEKLLNNKHVASIVRLRTLTSPSNHPEQYIDSVDIKTHLAHTCADIFLRYFCSVRGSCEPGFTKFVSHFDDIFYEVNQGYAYDFLPFLRMFYEKEMRKVEKCSEDIREFMVHRVLKDRQAGVEEEAGGTESDDYLECLLREVQYGTQPDLDLDTALFSLEDIVGGHSAVSNFLVKVLTFLVSRPDVQGRVLEEVERLGKDEITLEDRPRLVYTEAVVMETLRLVSSPIVPHVANQDVDIFGYKVKKDTLILLNNHDLNHDPALWTAPWDFQPTRFIHPETGGRSKPAHFLPFGGGRRSCMGYKLVQLISVSFLANLLKRFAVLPVPGEDYKSCPRGNLALPGKTFRFRLETR